MNKKYILLLWLFLYHISYSQNISNEKSQIEFFQIKILLNTVTEKITGVELLQTKIADVEPGAPLYPEDNYDMLRFEWTDAAGKNVRSANASNPCLQHLAQVSSYTSSYNFTTNATRDEDFSSVSNDEFNFSIYPNPTNDWLHLQLSEPANEDYLIKVYDMGGRLMANYEWLNGETEFSVSLIELPQGLYNIEIIGAALHESRKVLKL